MASDGPRCYKNMKLDAPIYRIHSYRYLGDLLAGKLILRSTREWKDPYENLIATCGYEVIGEDDRLKQVFFDKTRLPAFGQCWTTIQESDALWRIYSHLKKDSVPGLRFSQNEGVRLRTTPAKLVKCFASSFPDKNKGNCLVAPIRYLEEPNLTQHIANVIGTHRDQAFSGVSGHVDALRLKRIAFAHESEVRLLYIDADREFEGKDQIEVPIDVNAVIEEITLDPRIPEGTKYANRERWLRQRHFKNEINKSLLYQKIIMMVPLYSPEDLDRK